LSNKFEVCLYLDDDTHPTTLKLSLYLTLI